VKHYIIDGNNLIGRDKLLNQLQKKNKQQSREKLAFMLSRYFSMKKVSANLHYDGHEREVINASGIKIIYSGNYSADDKIKNEIEKSKDSRNIILITSDTNLMNFGRVCACQVIKSEEFIGHLKQSSNADEEELKTNSNINVEEYKRLFGIKSSDS
jgi:predicted RNA-binding protein with PIN domain